MRHKGVAVAAGERRHPRSFGIQLVLKKNRQIFLGHFAERNSHLIRPNVPVTDRRHSFVFELPVDVPGGGSVKRRVR